MMHIKFAYPNTVSCELVCLHLMNYEYVWKICEDEDSHYEVELE